LAAGTGSILAIRALAEPPADASQSPPAQPLQSAQDTNAPASMAPFDSPFLELIGCRIKQSVSFNLADGQAAAKQVSWVEQQYSQVQWTIDSMLRANVTGYAITLAPSDNPAAVMTIQADKSAATQALTDQLAQPGEYDLKIAAIGSNAQASAHITVAPLPFTQIMISDIQPDGTLRFVEVGQQLNLDMMPVTQWRFVDSDFVHVEKMTDDQGQALQFTSRHQGNLFQFHCMYITPVQPGNPMMSSTSGTITGLVRKLSGGIFLYAMNHSPGANVPTRRIELLRLPAGATLVSPAANMTSKTVDGRTQIFEEVVIPPGGSNRVAFRYRLNNAP